MALLTLSEWSRYTADGLPALAGTSLQDDGARRAAATLAAAGRLRVVEARNGLQIETTSWVGAIRLGELTLAVEPKLHGLPLMSLMRFAYGLRDIKLLGNLPLRVAQACFHDLLIHQLAAEVTELLARGLHRRYERDEAFLGSPRGRIDFTALSRGTGAARPALPCAHHPRKVDTPINRAVLAGLRLGVRLTSDLNLRGRLRGLASQLADGVGQVEATTELLQQARRQSSRLTAAYRPSLVLIELLMAGQGTAFATSEQDILVPGFLFDMNRFFQALISRFLSQHLLGYIVRDEHRLLGMLSYDPQRNPQRRRAPAPRPDFIVQCGGQRVAILDTKYRDLWEQPLPPAMLYQLIIYTSSSPGRRATILYPSLDSCAREACVEVRDPLTRGHRAEVLVRPVDMLQLERLVSAPQSAQTRREAAAFAMKMVFGEQAPAAVVA